jgi:hypothetical protein
MNVVVTFNDGNTINPIFEPTTRNLEIVKNFYLDLLGKNEIYHFSITYDNGEVFAMGRL